jgi:hypothetical protein
MTVAMPRLIVFPVPLWRVDMPLHVSKTKKAESTRSYISTLITRKCRKNMKNS